MNRTVAEAVEELSTIRDFIRWGMSLFNETGVYFGHGTDNALDDAAYLVLHMLTLPPYTSDHYLDTRLTRVEREAVAKMLERRVVERLPSPYLTNEAWFANMPFFVDERVLIPRSPVAELLEKGCEPWLSRDSVEDVLDMCTGSGCIGIAAAAYFPNALVDAVDICQDALDVANINVAKHHMEGQVHVFQSDLFENIPPKKRYDLIISNPPYVDAEDMANLPPEYRHEPAKALEAGEDGLDLVLRILQDASDHIKPRGVLIVEVGNSAHALQKLLPEVPFVWLDFEHGGEGVFLLSAERVLQHRELFRLVRASL